jgi:hypothetical protein
VEDVYRQPAVRPFEAEEPVAAPPAAAIPARSARDVDDGEVLAFTTHDDVLLDHEWSGGEAVGAREFAAAALGAAAALVAAVIALFA